MGKPKKNYNMPPGRSLFQTLFISWKFLQNPIGFISDSIRRFGNTYTTQLSSSFRFIITSDPAFINYVLRDNHTNYNKSDSNSGRLAKYLGSGLLFSNGDAWLKQRRLIQPGFYREKLQGLYTIVVTTINEFFRDMPVGEKIDMYPALHRLSFNIVIRSLFDIELNTETMQALSSSFDDIQGFVIKDINQPFRRPFYPINGAEKKMLAKAAAIRSKLLDIIRQRRIGTKIYNDLLAMLLEAKYEDTGLGMTDDQLIDEILVLMFAGHETTANTLSWLAYLIANNAHVAAKLSGIADSTDVYSSVRNDYIQAVINEGMRMFPAAWVTDRQALHDDSFGGYSYPAGTVIISFFYGAHNSAGYWQDSIAFKPERFLDDDGKIKKVKNFFPFGAGPRMCIGNSFAMAEMSFFLHLFFKQFTISPTGREPAKIVLITLRPDKVLLNVARKPTGQNLISMNEVATAEI